MDNFADLIFSELDACLDRLGLALITHESALDAYIEMFKATRKKELDEIKVRQKLNANYYPGLLLIVHKKTRAISSKKYVQSDYDEVGGKKIRFPQLKLAIVTRRYSEYIPVESNGQYNARRVLRFNNLRAYTEEDKNWVNKVVTDVNALNESGMQLRDAYLALAENHLTALKRYDLEKMKRVIFVDHDTAGS
jgi:hypothetical protein